MDEMNVPALVEIVQERAPGDDPLVLLEAAIAVAGEASGAADDLIEHYVGAARAANVSWTLIGERLGWHPKRNIQDAVRDLCRAFKAGKFPGNTLGDEQFINVKTVKKLGLK